MSPDTILVSNAVQFDPTQKNVYDALGIDRERALQLIFKTIEPLAKQAVKGRWNRVQLIDEIRQVVPDLQEFILCIQCMNDAVHRAHENRQQHRRGLMAIIPTEMPEA